MEQRKRHSVQRNLGRSEAEILYPLDKVCSACKERKTAANFHKSKREKDGLKSNCKSCGNKQRQDWYKRNTDHAKRKSAEWQKANPEQTKLKAKKTYYKNHASRRARAASAYDANKLKISQQERERYNNDPVYRSKKLGQSRASGKKRTAKIVAYAKVRRIVLPEKVQAIANATRLKRAGAAGKCTPAQWLEILEYFNYHCAYCLRPDYVVGKLTMDHMTPLTRGGTNDAENIVPACKSCNCSKNNKTVLEFIGDIRLPRKNLTNIAS